MLINIEYALYVDFVVLINNKFCIRLSNKMLRSIHDIYISFVKCNIMED